MNRSEIKCPCVSVEEVAVDFRMQLLDGLKIWNHKLSVRPSYFTVECDCRITNLYRVLTNVFDVSKGVILPNIDAITMKSSMKWVIHWLRSKNALLMNE